MSKRGMLTKEAVRDAELDINSLTVYRLEEKGRHALSSRHEILGLVEEEVNELKRSVEQDDLGQIKNELLDIAVACVVGVASIDSEEMDW